jgi:hypothetical protein
MKRVVLIAALLAALAVAAPALGSGGNYVVDGGTAAEQAQVHAALDASSFPWGVVQQQIAIHVHRGIDSFALKGAFWVDADLLDAGSFSWGTVQHEYAHEVDYFLLSDAARTTLLASLGGTSWWQSPTGVTAHGELASERLASTLCWAYWPSPANALRPAGAHDESAAMAPAAFKTLLAGVLGHPELAPAARTIAAVSPARA